MIKEHDRVVFLKDVSEEGLKAGDVGTVVHVYRQGESFEELKWVFRIVLPSYGQKRDKICSTLSEIGLTPSIPQGPIMLLLMSHISPDVQVRIRPCLCPAPPCNGG